MWCGLNFCLDLVEILFECLWRRLSWCLFSGHCNDLYRFNPGRAASSWNTFPPSDSAPFPRLGMGFMAALDGMLYVFGGADVSGGDSAHREPRKLVFYGG